ncbi:MAG: DUF1566 domain-containing protein [Methylococcaceae bacterium]
MQRRSCFYRFMRMSLGVLCLSVLEVQAADRFVVSADGQEVTDTKTGLIWRRCAEGMRFNGSTCTGSVKTYTHENALRRATAEGARTGVAWRLPNVKELASIVDRSRVSPAIDPKAFPVTQSAWFWSSSPYAGKPNDAWVVDFGDGNVDGYVNRDNTFAVRLVRGG